MAEYKYVNPNDLFVDEDVDDTFVNSTRSRNTPVPRQPAPSYGGHIRDLEQQRQVMLERQREIEQRTLDSSARSLQLLCDSENMGISTAHELARQHDALDNANRNLDEISNNLKCTKKHIKGIKSVFGGLKNYISGKSDQSHRQTSPNPQSSKGPSGSRLNNTQDNLGPILSGSRGDNYDSHPSTRLRGGMTEQAMAGPVTDSQRVNKMLDDNLDEMALAITRLKSLGSAFGEEIEKQNELIDTITHKVQDTEFEIGKQNKQMNKLLGK